MNRLIEFIEKNLLPVAGKIASNKPLTAIRNAMMSMSPFFIIGSFFLLFAYLPIRGYDEFLNSIFGENVLQNLLKTASTATISIMGLVILLSLAYHYAKIKETDEIYAVMISLMVFMILTPVVDGKLDLEWLGAKGMFIAIFIAFISTNAYIKIKSLNIEPKMPDTVPPAVSKSFAALFPIAIIAIVAVIVRGLFAMTRFGDIHNFVFTVVQAPLLALGTNVISLIVAEVIGQVLWFFGLHGNDIVGSVMRPIWQVMSAENLEAFSAGLPQANIINEQMRNVFMLIGGSGSTLPLVLSLIFVTKSKHTKTLGALSLPAAIFNINEPLIFGLPIVLNPTLFIPWIITTPILGLITYYSMKFGLVAITNGIMIPWTTPVLISGYLVSGISGVILQLVLCVVAFLIYYPFIKSIDNQMLKEETDNKMLKEEAIIVN